MHSVQEGNTFHISKNSANSKVKGVEIEYFTLCIALRKVIFFIYQKINPSDRVPLNKILANSQLLGFEGISKEKKLQFVQLRVVIIPWFLHYFLTDTFSEC